MYGSEIWRMTESDLKKISKFHTESLRRIKGYQMKISFNNVIKRKWKTSYLSDGVNGLDTPIVEIRTIFQRQHFFEPQKENESEENP